jgi:RNA polymerase sigma factor (sigma-70 family)
LYAIARHQAFRTLKTRDRELASDALPDKASREVGPDVHAARNELAAMITKAQGGLTDRDREVLNLVYRHELSGSELSQTLGVSCAAAKKMVQRLRDTVVRSLGALLVARQAESGYHRCSELSTIAIR